MTRELFVVAALLLMRLTGLILVAPVFSARTVPMPVRTGVLLALTVLLTPVALQHAVAEPRITAVSVLSELMVGVLIGLGAAVFIGAAGFAGDLLATQIGLSGASTVDPLNQATLPVVGQFTQLMIIAVILALRGDHLMLEAVADSMRAIAVGEPVTLAHGANAVTVLGRILFVEGLRFAAPVIATVTITNVALGVLARTVPQLNVLMVAFPVQIAVGLTTLALALPFVVSAYAGWPATFSSLAHRLVRGLAVGGP